MFEGFKFSLGCIVPHVFNTCSRCAPCCQLYPFQPISKVGTYIRSRGYRQLEGMERRNANRLACYCCISTQHLGKDY